MSARDHASRATTTGAIRFRPPTPSDGGALWRLARTVGLDANSPYAYIMWADFFAGSSIVAVDGMDQVVGFVNGFHPPDDPTTLFVWQVGVAPEARGRGIGGRMLDELLARSTSRWLEATVTPSNDASAALFRDTAVRHGADVKEAVGYPREVFPRDHDHEAEIRFRIGPLEGTTHPDT